ncbi:hypothetical protein C0W59_07520 [Photobacterium kishitanii]|uniref:hypothetical protein n=1 Tax=Photobacterium kishitanii TaxID=318456 RepID=UPI000D1545FC|nr:hypothetical protein [Photobacterium kishitanii]PSV16530.1 hypothetical protein C0W59_07520 [Photobacterium kishitanii]
MENKDVTEAINTLIDVVRVVKEQPDAAVIAAQYTVYGMLGVAFITLLGQLISTRFLVKSEMRKAIVQVSAERETEFNISWNKSVQELVTELLISTDPEVNQPKDCKRNVVRCVHSLNLLLNQNNPKHKALDIAVTTLAINNNGWAETDTVFNLHDRVIVAARDVIYQPQR